MPLASPRIDRLARVACLMAALGFAPHADAGLFRAYLSKNGSDTNNCTINAPCRLLPAALAAIDDGGEVWMVDSANFNVSTVLVNKSVTILAVPGALASIVGNGTDAMVINGTSIRVVLRNLSFLGLANSLNGILVNNASEVTIDRSDVRKFLAFGIQVNAPGTVVVSDSMITQNGNGIAHESCGPLTVNRATIVNNAFVGVRALCNDVAKTSTASIRDSVLNGNSYGATAVAGTGSSRIHVRNSEASFNGFDGFATLGNAGGLIGNARIYATGSSANRNQGWGFSLTGAFSILTDGTNQAVDNGSGAASSALGSSGGL